MNEKKKIKVGESIKESIMYCGVLEKVETWEGLLPLPQQAFQVSHPPKPPNKQSLLLIQFYSNQGPFRVWVSYNSNKGKDRKCQRQTYREEEKME